MTEGLNAMTKDICRDPDAWKARNPADMASARAAYYTAGSNPAWGLVLTMDAECASGLLSQAVMIGCMSPTKMPSQS